MAGPFIRLVGADEGVRALGQLRDAIGRFTARPLSVGSDLVYAWGIETGFRKNGAVARKAGGAHYLAGALQSVSPRVSEIVAARLPEGASGADRAWQEIGDELVQEAQAIVPVRSGDLRASIRSTPGA